MSELTVTHMRPSTNTKIHPHHGYGKIAMIYITNGYPS